MESEFEHIPGWPAVAKVSLFHAFKSRDDRIVRCFVCVFKIIQPLRHASGFQKVNLLWTDLHPVLSARPL